MANFNLNDYVQVNERVMKFWQDHKEGRINTEIIRWEDGVIVMKAVVFANCTDAEPNATGNAYEKEESSHINKTSALENCETSAIGRALAVMGYEIKKSIASREEVSNAVEQQNKLKQAASTTTRTTTEQRGATTAQINAIRKIAESKKVDISKHDLKTMTTTQASNLIKELNAA